MAHPRLLFGLCFVVGACDLDNKPPPVPDGYPKLGEYQEGEAELNIDGEHYVTEYSGGLAYNVEGGYDDELRANVDFDDLQLTFRDVEVGVYAIATGDLEASYAYDFTADRQCGEGNIEIIGRKHYDAGLLGEREVCWGTIQLELCDGDSEGAVDTTEVSGRFTAIISRN